MGNINVQQHKFVIKAGMTVDDVKNSKEATALQKKYASAFDTDGQKGFSQKEADLFNATTFSEKADGSVTFWTRQKDGTKKGTKFNSKDNIQFKSNEEVKPYVKKVTVKKASPKKNESVSFFDEAWSGHQIAKLTGDNVVTDWLQDKDKKCTDEKDDGKLSIGQYALSFAKGLIGGIPKAIINHPVATAVAIGAGAVAVAATGGAILPVLGAIGVATGVGMTGYGGYKALTAKTDGEAKQALETMGMGVTTTALSVAAADKALEKAAEAGVKSAEISDNASIVDKTIQMFKATPEALKVSANNTKDWLLSFSPVPKTPAQETALAEKNFERKKVHTKKFVEKFINRNAKDAPLNSRYQDPELQQKLVDVLTKDNIDLAQELLSDKIGFNYRSNYAVYAEHNCDYVLETVPRILASEDPKVIQAAQYIINQPEICDKVHALGVLNSENAEAIMSLRSSGNISLQRLMWEKFPPKYNLEELLPFIDDYENEVLSIYAPKGVVPNTPGAKMEVYTLDNGKTYQRKFLIYQEHSPKRDLFEAQKIARSLLEEYGSTTTSENFRPAVFKDNVHKFNWLITNGCQTQEDKTWLSNFILSDEYKLVQ